ncbi:methyltransferase domain-containing protein [Rhodoferax sp.]|uniref:methyltransferase domain-containing protein n=1 Tax=Rhodoferax sp. TaxID=50421 RepID=UPI002728C6D8|nr:methyltransferase domain-containing protein [Rhodoferax sp.]MDO9195013.1 methyltransferase domain-containing protein [Rhodoferax sp.]
MYTENPGKDAFRFAKAIASNQVARFAPKLFVKITHQTGRGDGEEKPAEIADYFIRCYYDYQEQLGLADHEFRDYLSGRSVLEYGPGDVLGVALLMYAHGAKSVCCVDRFPLSNLSNKNIEVYARLLDSLGHAERERASNAFNEKGNPRSGLNSEAISYKVTSNGLSGAFMAFDLIISRAVLEHVNDLAETMVDIKRGMKKTGISLHQVDLKSHGLDRYKDFDFLTWPKFAYDLMYSHKGFPNRWRVDRYRELAASAGLHMKNLSPTGRLEQRQIKVIHPKVARQFSRVSPDELSWLGFWMLLEHAE